MRDRKAQELQEEKETGTERNEEYEEGKDYASRRQDDITSDRMFFENPNKDFGLD